MITARSTLTRNLFRSRKDTQNALAAFVQTPLPSPTSDEQEKPGFARHMTSPAYRRYMQKQKGDVAIKGNQPSIGAAQDGIQIPTNEVARSMGWKFSEMENEALVVIAEMKNHGARVEVLRRHIMATDDIDYEAAGEIIEKIVAKNQDGMTRAALPYKVAIATAVVTGFGAIPMVFSIDVAKWFNLAFVTMEIPEPSDLETALGKFLVRCKWLRHCVQLLLLLLLSSDFFRRSPNIYRNASRSFLCLFDWKII